MHATLVVLAAGLGSRFKGGIKQLEPLGPSGEIIMDYSIYDAKQAGFDKVVFIIRKDIRAAFDKMIGDRIKQHIAVDYVYQELDRLPEGLKCPGDRVYENDEERQKVIRMADYITRHPGATTVPDPYYGGAEGFELALDLIEDGCEGLPKA